MERILNRRSRCWNAWVVEEPSPITSVVWIRFSVGPAAPTLPSSNKLNGMPVQSIRQGGGRKLCGSSTGVGTENSQGLIIPLRQMTQVSCITSHDQKAQAFHFTSWKCWKSKGSLEVTRASSFACGIEGLSDVGSGACVGGPVKAPSWAPFSLWLCPVKASVFAGPSGTAAALAAGDSRWVFFLRHSIAFLFPATQQQSPQCGPIDQPITCLPQGHTTRGWLRGGQSLIGKVSVFRI